MKAFNGLREYSAGRRGILILASCMTAGVLILLLCGEVLAASTVTTPQWTATSSYGHTANFKGRVTYETSSDKTSVTVTLSDPEMYCSNKDDEINVNAKTYLVISGDGSSVKWSGSISWPKNTNGWKSFGTGTKSITVSKGKSARTVTFTVRMYNEGNYSGDVSNTFDVTIPALASYTVSYNSNGGSNTPTDQTKYYDIDLTLKAGSAMTPPAGHTWSSKWNTAADGSGTVYSAGGTYKKNAALKLYAMWTPMETEVTFNPSGGSFSGTTGYTYKTMTYGRTDNNSVGAASRSGYVFQGWYTGSGGTGIKVYDSDGDGLAGAYWSANAWGSTMTSAVWLREETSLMLYAHYTVYEPPSYTVTLNPNGGVYNGSQGNTERTVTKGSSANNRIGMAVKPGSVFTGWYTYSSGGTQVYDMDGDATAGVYWNGSGSSAVWRGTSGVTLYAHWSSDVRVYFNPAGGSIGGDSSITSKLMTIGSEAVSAGKPARGGYIFTGWYSSPSGGIRVFGPDAKYIRGTQYCDDAGRWIYSGRAETVMYAGWISEAEASSRITLNPNGGRVDGSETSAVRTAVLEDTMSNSVSIAVRPLYTFTGWYTAASGGVKVYDSSGRFIEGDYWTADGRWKGNSDITLFAGWTPRTAETYSIIYNAAPGSWPGGGESYIDHKTEEETYVICSDVPIYSGHSFSGWNTHPDGTGIEYQPGGYYSLNEELELYAVWSESPSYAVTYDANGGDGAPAEQSKYENEDLVLSSDIPAREGYTFGKWNSRADGTGTDYLPGDVYRSDGALKLYAQWEPAAARGEACDYRVMFAVGRSGAGAQEGNTEEGINGLNIRGEGYRYALFSGSPSLRNNGSFLTRSLAFGTGKIFGYHYVDAEGSLKEPH